MAEPENETDYDDSLSQEFCLVRDKVYDRLRQAADVPSARWLRVGQLLVLSEFEIPYSWDVLRDPHSGIYSLHRTCWRLDLDDPVFESRAERNKHPVPFVPTIETVPVPIPSDRLRELLDAFHGVSIPIGLAAPASGQDGVTFELQVGDFWGGCRLNWWCDLPREWLVLHPLVSRMAAAFEGAYMGCGCKIEPGG